MRLLRVSDLKLVEFMSDTIPPYAILSHTWCHDQEVIFEDMLSGTAENKPCFTKLKKTAEQAATDGFEYVWIDNCCIDKRSSAELSEALNSMYAWYQAASICYAYLSDVPTDVRIQERDSEFARCRWSTRGFTLQELLAPREVVFFSSEWKVIGRKSELYEVLSTITGIGVQYLSQEVPLSSASIASRMSWAAKRNTSRPEDVAYCLLGIFNIHMPLLYGEGERAFIRLQEEIMRQSDDHSIFAWRDLDAPPNTLHGLLARSPRHFSFSGKFIPYSNWESLSPYGMTHRGLQISLFLNKCSGDEDNYVAAINCPVTPSYKDGTFLGIFLKKLSSGDEQYLRSNIGEFAHIQDSRGDLKAIFVRQSSQKFSLSVGTGVYPYHVAQLRKGPRSYCKEVDVPFEAVRVIAPESVVSSQSHRQYFKSTLGDPARTPEFLLAAQKVREDWLPERFHNEFPVPKVASTLAGAIVFERPTDAQRVCVMIGSMRGFDVGFDAIELSPDMLVTEPPHEALDMLQQRFNPKPEHERIVLERARCYIHVGPYLHRGVKYYMVDVTVMDSGKVDNLEPPELSLSSDSQRSSFVPRLQYN
ncbi:hypothetical protein AbraIFM66951_004592 [Aspergillus brasiliensis]|uniref:Heterokaryon incompatibility domain-containing protein n=1 Tax=Aspergillus brasiliensis TaxID=319629 RepID=A0A9W5YJC1_9EURO|nr:hypothetical protein AbraCBS73388_011563 [Aspergillus brasiliensis]GKZ50900.1 hypothetical protein AbraIFM66951_004592 [Aspergillus brasiliensis]